MIVLWGDCCCSGVVFVVMLFEKKILHHVELSETLPPAQTSAQK